MTQRAATAGRPNARRLRIHRSSRRIAALIRSLGGLPEPCDFGPPPPGQVAAIVTGTGPTLRALDAEAGL